jgi:hypothetical protein
LYIKDILKRIILILFIVYLLQEQNKNGAQTLREWGGGGADVDFILCWKAEMKLAEGDGVVGDKTRRVNDDDAGVVDTVEGITEIP